MNINEPKSSIEEVQEARSTPRKEWEAPRLVILSGDETCGTKFVTAAEFTPVSNPS